MKHLLHLNKLCVAPVLAYPQLDGPFILQTDASDYGIGAVLAQVDTQGQERVILNASRTLDDRKKNHSAMEKEALAVIFATHHFRVYLLGCQLTKPLFGFILLSLKVELHDG